MLNSLQTPLTQILAIDKFPTESEISNVDLTWIQNAKLSETGGLPYNLEIKLGARIMITRNIDIDDKLINGIVGNIVRIMSRNGKVSAIYVKLDDETAGAKSMPSDHLTRGNRWVKIERVEASFNTKKRFSNSPAICRTQFPLMLSWACTCHKVQGLSLPSAVISFELFKQKQFNAGQMYVALSRVINIDRIYLLGEYKENAIRINKKAELKYERLRQENLFKPLGWLETPSSSFTITLLNVRSLSKQAVDIASDKRLCDSDIICLTETQLTPEFSTVDLDNCLNTFHIDYNTSSIHRFNSLAFCHNKTVSLEEHVKLNGTSLITFKKSEFRQRSIKLALIYRQPSHSVNQFYDTLIHLTQSHSVDILLGDFNINALDNILLANILHDFMLVAYSFEWWFDRSFLY